jgi:hypothetical protein
MKHSLDDVKNFFSYLEPKKGYDTNDYKKTNELISNIISYSRFVGEDICVNENWYLITSSNELITNNFNVEDQALYDYCKKIVVEFSEIRLDVIDFKLPITDFVKLPLLKYDKQLQEKKERLELLLENTIEKNQKRALEDKISSIKSLLSKEFNIIEVLEFGEDIFIEAPAGYGKSTTLRWLTYTFAEKALTGIKPVRLPIFIELKNYTREVQNLESLILDELQSYLFNTEKIFEYKILLFLDGYDEYTFSKKKFFNELKRIKRKYETIQVIFTGRVCPNFSVHNIDFVIYNLNIIDESDVRKLFQRYLGNDVGQEYFNLTSHYIFSSNLNTPLFVVFVLSFIKSRIDEDKLEIESITSILMNKGLLFDTLLIDKFLQSYEADKAEVDISKRKIYKEDEIKLIAKLAFQMTFKLGDIEQLKYGSVIKFFEINGFSSTLIDEFRNHNILKLNNEFVSFEKKDIRLFFAAKHFISQTKNHVFFENYRSKHRYSNSWKSVDVFILGLIEPEKVIDINQFPKDYTKIVLSNYFINQLELLLTMFDQRNFCKKLTYLNINYVNKIVEDSLLRYKTYISFNLNEKNRKYSFFLLRKFLSRVKHSRNYISQETIYSLNNDFLSRMVSGHYVSYSCIFRRYNLNVSITEYLNFLDRIHTFLPDYSELYFFNIYEKESKLAFSEKEVLTIIYNFFFLNISHDPFFITYKMFETSFKSTFLVNNLHLKFDEFIVFFHENHPGITPKTYLRLLLKLEDIRLSFSIKAYCTYPIEIQHAVLMVLFEGIVFTKNLDKKFYDYYLFDLLNNIKDEELRKRLADKSFEFIGNVNEGRNQRKRAFIILLLTDNGDLLDLLLEDLKKNQKSNVKTIVNETLLNLYDKLKGITSVFKLRFLSDYLKFLLENDLSNERLINSLLEIVKSTTDNLNELVIKLSNENKISLYHAISFFEYKRGKEVEEFLIQQLESVYAPWCLDMLYHIDINYHFKFINKLSFHISRTRRELLSFKYLKESLDSIYSIIEVLYLCDESLLKIYYELLNSEEHLSKLYGFSMFGSLKRSIEKKVITLRNYQLKNTF